MSTQADQVDSDLAVECKAFSAYLTGMDAGDYVRRKYCEAHQITDLIEPVTITRFERYVLRFSCKGILHTRFADIYTRWFHRKNVLRRKLLLLTAILECAGTTYRHFEYGECSTLAGFGLWLTGKGIGFVLSAAIAIPVFTVARCMFSLSHDSSERQQAGYDG